MIQKLFVVYGEAESGDVVSDIPFFNEAGERHFIVSRYNRTPMVAQVKRLQESIKNTVLYLMVAVVRGSSRLHLTMACLWKPLPGATSSLRSMSCMRPSLRMPL